MSNVREISVGTALWRVAGAVAVLVVALLPAVTVTHYSLDEFDEAYQMLNCTDYRNTPLAPLSALIGGLYCSLTAWSLLAARYYALGCVALAVICSTVWFWRRTRRYGLTLAVGGVCLFLATIYRSTHITFSWDNLTLLSAVLIAIAFAAWLRRPCPAFTAALAALTAFAVLVRVPNVVFIVPVTLGLIVFRPEGGRWWWTAPAYFLLTAVLLYIGLVSLYGSPGAWTDALAANPIGSHDSYQIFSKSPPLFMHLLPGAALMWVGYHLLVRARGRRGLTFVLAVLFMAMMYFYLKQRTINVEYIFLMFMGLAVGAVVYYDRSRLLSGHSATAIFIFFIALAPCAGSNTLLIKAVIWPMMPLLAAMYLPHITAPGRVFVPVMTFCFVAFAYSNVRYGALTGSGLFQNMDETTSRIPEGRLAGIVTTPAQAGFVMALQTDVRAATADGSELLVLRRYGQDYLWEYLFDARNPYLRHSFDYNDCQADPDYIAQVRTRVALPGARTVLFMRPEHRVLTPMQEMLDSQMTRAVVEPRYIIYKKK